MLTDQLLPHANFSHHFLLLAALQTPSTNEHGYEGDAGVD